MTEQSREIFRLSEYLAAEAGAGEKNLAAFDPELEMSSYLFEAGQEVYASQGFLNTDFHRVIASLLVATNRLYASAVSLSLRGCGPESSGTMRSSLECAGYLVKIWNDRSLAPHWIKLNGLSKKDKLKLFGSETSLMKQPLMSEPGLYYENLSVFGVHARIPLASQVIDFHDPKGWRLRYADVGDNFSRMALLGANFAMHDIRRFTFLPLFWKQDHPKHIVALLDRWEEARKAYGPKRLEFVKWLQKPDWKRPRKVQTLFVQIRGSLHV